MLIWRIRFADAISADPRAPMTRRDSPMTRRLCCRRHWFIAAGGLLSGRRVESVAWRVMRPRSPPRANVIAFLHLKWPGVDERARARPGYQLSTQLILFEKASHIVYLPLPAARWDALQRVGCDEEFYSICARTSTHSTIIEIVVVSRAEYYLRRVKESLLFVNLLPRARTLLLNANAKEFDGNLDKRAIRWRGVCRRRGVIIIDELCADALRPLGKRELFFNYLADIIAISRLGMTN